MPLISMSPQFIAFHELAPGPPAARGLFFFFSPIEKSPGTVGLGLMPFCAWPKNHTAR